MEVWIALVCAGMLIAYGVGMLAHTVWLIVQDWRQWLWGRRWR